MIKDILPPERCAQCRLCCHFDIYSLSEQPVFDDVMLRRIMEFSPRTRFSEREEGWLYLPAEEEYACPALDPERGCILGDGKPFVCRIWPFTVKENDGRTEIALSPLCPAFENTDPEVLNAYIERVLLKRISKTSLTNQGSSDII